MYGYFFILINSVRVPPRNGSVKIEMKGIFVNAKVIRGPDWEWGQQDGGNGTELIIFYFFIHMNSHN